MKKRTRRQKAILKRRIFLSACTLILAAVIALIVFVVNSIINISDSKPEKQPENTNNSSSFPRTSPLKQRFPFSFLLSLIIANYLFSVITYFDKKRFLFQETAGHGEFLFCFDRRSLI